MKAELFDGTILEFEDGTPDDVVRRVVKTQTDRIRTEQSRVPLPEDVEPSKAGGGRGFVNPPAVQPPRRGGTRAEAAPYVAGDARVVAPPQPAANVLDRPAPPDMPMSPADLEAQSMPLARRAQAVAPVVQGMKDRAQTDLEIDASNTSAPRKLADLGVAAAGGVVTGFDLIAKAVGGADNGVSQALGAAGEVVKGLRSASAERDEQRIGAILKQAEDAGVFDSLAAAGKAFGVAPFTLIAQGIGTSVPNILAMLLPGVRESTIGALAAAGGIGAAQGAGSVKGNIFDAVQQEMLSRGMTPDEARDRARAAQAYISPNADQIGIGAALGLLAGATGGERFALNSIRSLLNKPAVQAASRTGVGAFARGTAVETGTEALQGGQEQLATNIALQREGANVPTMRGVVSQGGMEALAGFGSGAAMGAVDLATQRTPEQEIAGAINQNADTFAKFFAPVSRDAAPTQARAESVKRLDEVAAAFGLSPRALSAVRDAAGAMPADDVPAFLGRAVTAMSKQQLFAKPLDPEALDALAKRLRPAEEAKAPATGPTEPDGDPEQDPLWPEFAKLSREAARAEKDSDPANWTPAQRKAYDSGDWREFSRLRGYTPAEIDQYGRYQQAAEALIAKYGVDSVQGAEMNLSEPAPTIAPSTFTPEEAIARMERQAQQDQASTKQSGRMADVEFEDREATDILSPKGAPWASKVSANKRLREMGGSGRLARVNTGWVIKPEEGAQSDNQPDVPVPADVDSGAADGGAPDPGRGVPPVGPLPDADRGMVKPAEGTAPGGGSDRAAGSGSGPDAALTEPDATAGASQPADTGPAADPAETSPTLGGDANTKPDGAAAPFSTGDAFTLAGKSYTVTKAGPKSAVISGEDGKNRTVTSDGKTWAAMLEQKTSAAAPKQAPQAETSQAPTAAADAGAAAEPAPSTAAGTASTAVEADGVAPEQAIRKAAEAVPNRTIGSWEPITVEARGKTQQFLSNIKRVVSDGKGPQAVTLMQIRPGRMLPGEPLRPLVYGYRLTRKNELVEEGIPREPSEAEANRWAKAFNNFTPLNAAALDDKKAPPSGRVPEAAAPAKPAEADRRERLAGIASRLGINVVPVSGGFRASGSSVEIPDGDVEAFGAQTADHIFAHELGHAVMQKRGFSFKGFPKSEVVKRISNYDELIAASKDYRPAVHGHADERIRRYAKKPDEILADAIGSVLLDTKPIDLLRPLMESTGMTERDLGLEPAAASKPEATQPPTAEPATPQPLYASRPLTPASAEAIRAWAASQGFTKTLPAADLHVTVAYSREPVDGAAVKPAAASVTVSGGKRTVEPLGDEGAVVLKFASPDMQARWKQYRDAGASWDYESYTPHVTLTYDGAGLDLSKIAPYAGPIELGPERQEPLNVDKADEYKEAEVATPQPQPTPNPFAEYDALAQEYGYEVRPDGSIGSDGKFPGPKMRLKGGRLRIESGSGDLLGSYASPSPASLGKFLEGFWYAEKKKETPAPEPTPQPPAESATPQAAGEGEPSPQAKLRRDIPSGAAGDALLRAMPIDTKEQAQEFVRAHKDWLAANNPYGMGAMTPKNAKPATLRAPDIGEKVRKAYDIAEANYWQMPFSEAKVRFYGLPRAKWEAERSKRGLPTDDAAEVAQAAEQGAEAPIRDVGEKIGGARKDLAASTGPGRKRTEDTRPAWARRFQIAQNVTGLDENGDSTGRWVIRDTKSLDWMKQPKQVGRTDYATREEAEAFVPIAAVGLKHRPVLASTKQGEPDRYEIWRDITDRKRVKVVDQQFATRDEAMAYMVANAVQIIETNTTFGEADIPLPPNRSRTGPERRTGNVAGEDFKTAFGFRGVEFGNWNNQDERQSLMNDAWDGLMDLADVLGLPPKALGLNGDLALAFGARGNGLQSARAHYELERAVINLTKEKGAGSLAHEWFHALDHYFGRQDGKASATWEVQEDGTRVLKAKGDGADMASSGFRFNRSGVRPEVRAAYEKLLTTMFKKAETYVEDTAKVDKFAGRTREDLAEQLDRLRKDLSEQKDPRYWKRNNAPASAEVLAEFDALAKAMLDGDILALTSDWRIIKGATDKAKSAARWTNDSLERLGAIYKQVRGRSGFSAEKNGTLDSLRGYMSRYAERLKMLADAQQGTEKTKMVPTDFAMNAKELDQGRGGDYWTTPHEMAARAFQGYVEDKIAEQGGASRFLNYGPENVGILTPWGFKRPFPTGQERKAINGALDEFIKTIQTRTDDAGNVALYDLSRLGARMAQMGYEPQRAPTVQASRRMQSLIKRLDEGKITPAYFEMAVRSLAQEMDTASQTKAANSLMKDRERGADIIRERLIRARRQGDLDNVTVEFALWALNKNAKLAENLGISVKAPPQGKEGVSGDYNPAAEIIRLFKGGNNEETAVHEIMHHAERMMPGEMQAAIRGEWAKALSKVVKTATPAQKAALENIGASMAGDRKAHEAIIKAFNDGVLDYDAHYQLVNPSEFWAVNASRLLANRWKSEVTPFHRIANWLSEMVSKVKGLLGLSSDAPVLRALNAVMRGDGSKQSKFMLSDVRGMKEGPALNALSRADQTQTPEFKKWFAGSKVVDAEGKPLVVYHGTTKGGFTVFDRNMSRKWRQASMDTVGSWFSDNPSEDGGAGMYAAGGESTIYPVYLSIKNPKVYRTFEDFLRHMHRAAGRKMEDQPAPGRGSTEELRAELKADGYDGIEFMQTDNGSLMQDIKDMMAAVDRAKTDEFSVKRVDRLPYTQKRERLEQTLKSMRKELDEFGSSTEFDKQRVFIAFEPEQIKSAIGNRGTFDPFDPSILNNLSRPSKTPAQERKALTEALKTGGLRDVRLPAGYVMGDFMGKNLGTLHWWHKSVGTPFNLAERNPKFKRVYDSIQNFMDDVSHYANEAADMAPTILPRLDKLADIIPVKIKVLGKEFGQSPIAAKDAKAVAAPVFEGTLGWIRTANGDPIKVSEAEKQAEGMSADEKAQELLRSDKINPRVLKMWQGLPVEQYEQAIETRYASQVLRPGVVWSDAELRSQFKLDDRQIALYREFRSATDKSLDGLSISAMLRVAGEEAADVREAALNAGDLNDAAELIRDRLFELAAEQPDRADDLNQAGNDVIDIADKVQDLKDRGYAPLSRFGKLTLDVVTPDGERQYFGMFETGRERNKMARQMAANFPGATITQGTTSDEEFKLFAGVTPETLELFGDVLGMTDEQGKDKLFQDYLRKAKSSRSGLKRLIHRKGVPGFSDDIGRVLASFVYSNARQTSSNLHAGITEALIEDIGQQDGQLKDYAIQLNDYVKNPQEEAQAIRSVLFAQFLGGSISSALLNASQPFMVTFPYLAQFGGTAKAGAQMARATKDVARKTFPGDPGLAAAMKAAEEDGIVSPQEVFALQAQASGRAPLKTSDGTALGWTAAAANNGWSRLVLAWGQPFAFAEQFNRRLTFIAAYRTAKEQGIGDPSEFARRAVTVTQFTYGKNNRPPWARGAVGSVLFTFKTFSISATELLTRMSQAGPPGRRTALVMLGMMALVAGLDGLPFMEDIEDVIDGFAQRVLDKNWSTKEERNRLIARAMVAAIGQDAGMTVADFIAKGLSGLPGSPIDVSGRMGLHDLIPGTGVFLKKQDYARDIGEIAGPAGSLVGQYFDAAGKLMAGRPAEAAAAASPVAIQNAIKSAKMVDRGYYPDTKERMVVKTDGTDAAFKAIGIQPKVVARTQDITFQQQRIVGLARMVETEIVTALAKARIKGDAEAEKEARDRLATWNRRNPTTPIRIKPEQITRAAKNMTTEKTERILKTTPRELRPTLQDAFRKLDEPAEEDR